MTLANRDSERTLAELTAPFDPGALLAGGGPWEVEIGFGKGRYLLRRALAAPGTRFLGIEVAAQYWGLLVERMRRRGARNLLAVRGEAEALLAALLPPELARAVHVYFPDPWPKARHQRRRLFDPSSIDLVLGLLAPGGRLFFATDHLRYGEVVASLLAAYPGVVVTPREGPWAEGPRTNYEAKYLAEGRPILRLEAVRRAAAGERPLHPDGWRDVAVGYRLSVPEPATREVMA
ncbi:MAG TPA: tRNA (guanosine(46)-N7)-methyltransferase TrmB [Thermoanaerobaculia bacterium]|nr:tRNA (guanosine(46)-N7)-methyltransferase TrmB [Thermoanaerobaculia bacterium]